MADACHLYRLRGTTSTAFGGDARRWAPHRSVIAVTGRQRDQIDSGVEALARIGKGWDEQSLIMLHDGAEAIALGAALSAPTRHLGDSVVA
jgi:hypothetical protein